MLLTVQKAPSFVEAHGHQLEYVDIAGDSPDLLFLHEGLGSVSLWRDFPQRLAARTGRRAIVYSRAGFGRSSPRRTPYTVEFMHEEALHVIPALRDRLRLRSTILVGHSTGASMALIHAGLEPEANGVAGVVAIAPFAFVEDSNLQAIRAARERYGKLRERLARHHDDVDAVFHGWNDLWLDASFRGWSIDEDLGRIRCPILAILGDKDEYCTPAQLERLAALASHARQVEIVRLPESGHSPQRDDPDVTIEHIARFIGTLES